MATRKFCDIDPVNYASEASPDNLSAMNEFVDEMNAALISLFDGWEDRLKKFKLIPHQCIAFNLIDMAARVLILEEGEGDADNFGMQCVRIYEYATQRVRELKQLN